MGGPPPRPHSGIPPLTAGPGELSMANPNGLNLPQLVGDPATGPLGYPFPPSPGFNPAQKPWPGPAAPGAPGFGIGG